LAFIKTKIIEKIEMSKLLMGDGRWMMEDFFNFRIINNKFN
jgi:hypothetical protein